MTTTNIEPGAPLKTDRVTLRRFPTRGEYSLDAVAEVLDQTFLCHIGFVVTEQPFVIPTSFGRSGDRIFVHGSSASRMLRELSKGVTMCVTATIVDGIVLARSAFNHSMNYRSVVALGTAVPVQDGEKLAALELMAEHMLPGRWADTRWPNDIEMLATTVLAMDLKEASVKIRTGPPMDDEEDMDHSCWAGLLPLSLQAGKPVVDPRTKQQLPEPAYLTRLRGLDGSAT